MAEFGKPLLPTHVIIMPGANPHHNGKRWSQPSPVTRKKTLLNSRRGVVVSMSTYNMALNRFTATEIHAPLRNDSNFQIDIQNLWRLDSPLFLVRAQEFDAIHGHDRLTLLETISHDCSVLLAWLTLKRKLEHEGQHANHMSLDMEDHAIWANAAYGHKKLLDQKRTTTLCLTNRWKNAHGTTYPRIFCRDRLTTGRDSSPNLNQNGYGLRFIKIILNY